MSDVKIKNKLPPREELRFLKPNLEGSPYWPESWTELNIKEYPPAEKATIFFFDDQGNELAELVYTHPCNAYLGDISITGSHAKIIQKKINWGGIVKDPWLDTIEGVFPHVWSWVHEQAVDMQLSKHQYGIDRIEVENPPGTSAYQWIPDPTQWGAFDLVFKPLEDDEDEDDDFFREEYYSRER